MFGLTVHQTLSGFSRFTPAEIWHGTPAADGLGVRRQRCPVSFVRSDRTFVRLHASAAVERWSTSADTRPPAVRVIASCTHPVDYHQTSGSLYSLRCCRLYRSANGNPTTWNHLPARGFALDRVRSEATRGVRSQISCQLPAASAVVRRWDVSFQHFANTSTQPAPSCDRAARSS